MRSIFCSSLSAFLRRRKGNAKTPYQTKERMPFPFIIVYFFLHGSPTLSQSKSRSEPILQSLIVFIREDPKKQLALLHILKKVDVETCSPGIMTYSSPRFRRAMRSFFFFRSSAEVSFFAFFVDTILLPMASTSCLLDRELKLRDLWDRLCLHFSSSCSVVSKC